MKRNFYLQHPIMAMNDPRMKKLIDKERLKGSGAYWFIIEKLALLPEPRAQLEYLQPFCVGRKIPLSYLQKIIREYDLFIFDEDNYFTPAELNPAKKKDEKSVENVSGTDVSVSENNRKVQKTSRKKAEKESLKVGNSLNGSLLPKDTPAIGKENIKDIKTTATTEEKEETAADAATLPSVCSSGSTPPPPPSVTVTVCDEWDEPRRPQHPIRPWRELVDELGRNRLWMEMACMRSGYGAMLARHLPEAIEFFKQHVELYGKGDNLLTESDVRSYFVNFVSAGGRTSKALFKELTDNEARKKSELRESSADPLRYEQIVNGKRTYLGCPIPDDAPPRPDPNAVWNEELCLWMSGRKNKRKPD